MVIDLTDLRKAIATRTVPLSCVPNITLSRWAISKMNIMKVCEDPRFEKERKRNMVDIIRTYI